MSRKYEHRKRHEISLADLATDAEVEIVPDHLKAAAVVLSHARHGDAGVFDAVDQIVEDADLGRIAIGQNAAERIEDYRRNSAYRWLSAERVESLRDRVLGPPFPALWRSLVVATHEFIGRLTTDDLIGSPVPANVSQEPIRAAAAAVATHASERGWGTTYAAAETLQAQLRAARRILSRRSIERAYCSRDFFGVIAHATDVDIDDITRALALSEAGVIVFSWLAKKAEILSGCDDTELIVLDPLGTDGDPLEDPSDGDFLEAEPALPAPRARAVGGLRVRGGARRRPGLRAGGVRRVRAAGGHAALRAWLPAQGLDVPRRPRRIADVTGGGRRHDEEPRREMPDEARGLLRRFGPQVPERQGAAQPVLADGLERVPLGQEDADQGAVGGFPQRVGRHRGESRFGGLREPAAVREAVGQAFQRAGPDLPEPLAFEVEPVLVPVRQQLAGAAQRGQHAGVTGIAGHQASASAMRSR